MLSLEEAKWSPHSALLPLLQPSITTSKANEGSNLRTSPTWAGAAHAARRGSPVWVVPPSSAVLSSAPDTLEAELAVALTLSPLDSSVGTAAADSSILSALTRGRGTGDSLLTPTDHHRSDRHHRLSAPSHSPLTAKGLALRLAGLTTPFTSTPSASKVWSYNSDLRHG